MSSVLPFLRLNISGSREFIVQNINSALIFFIAAQVLVAVTGASSSGGQLRSLWLFSEILQCEWNTIQRSAVGNYWVLCGVAAPCRPLAALPKGNPLSVDEGSLLHWQQCKEITLGLGSVLFPGCSSKNYLWGPGSQTWKAERPIPEKHNRICVEQHSWQQVFDLKYLRYFSSFN